MITMNFAIRMILSVLVLQILSARPLIALPPNVYDVSDIKAAMVIAHEKAKPLVIIVYTPPDPNSPNAEPSEYDVLCEKVFNSFKDIGIVVAINFENIGDPDNDFLKSMFYPSPQGAWGLNGEKERARTIPHVWVTTVDGSKNIESIAYKELNGDIDRVIKRLERKLKKADIYASAKPPVQVPANAQDDQIRAAK